MRVKSLNENHLVISQSFSGVCVIVLAFLSSALFQIVLRAEKMTIGLHLVSFAPFVFLFGIGLTMLRSLELKEDGIYHKWLGICYKKTEWKRVQDIARAYQGRNGPAILVTMQGTHVFTQAEYQHAFGHSVFYQLSLREIPSFPEPRGNFEISAEKSRRSQL